MDLQKRVQSVPSKRQKSLLRDGDIILIDSNISITKDEGLGYDR